MILRFLLRDQAKKPTAFKIGVFTVFIVVAFMVMMTGLVQTTPIVFVSMSQNEAGAIDFMLTPTLGEGLFTDANVNPYSLNPFTYGGPPYQNTTWSTEYMDSTNTSRPLFT